MQVRKSSSYTHDGPLYFLFGEVVLKHLDDLQQNAEKDFPDSCELLPIPSSFATLTINTTLPQKK